MKRPKIISVLCIIGFIMVVFAFVNVFSPDIKRIGMAVPAIYGAIIAMQFISLVGVWYFKQWGTTAYLIAFFSKLIFHILINDTGIGFYVFVLVSIISMVYFLRYFSKMNPNF